MNTPTPRPDAFDIRAQAELFNALKCAEGFTNSAFEVLLGINARYRDAPVTLGDWADRLRDIEHEIAAAAKPLNTRIINAAEEIAR